jgi:phage protein D
MTRTAGCFVWANGQKLSPHLLRHIKHVSFEFELNKATTGTVIIDDFNFTFFDSEYFTKGKKLTFLIGWADEMVIIGPMVIRKVALDIPDSGLVSLTLDLQDASHFMNKCQKQKRRVGSPTKIIKEIAAYYGLGYDIDTIPNLEFTDDEPLMQSNITDAALVRRLAKRYGYVWGIDGVTLKFKIPPDLDPKYKQSIGILSYRIGDCSLMSFNPEMKHISDGTKVASKKRTSNDDICVDDGPHTTETKPPKVEPGKKPDDEVKETTETSWVVGVGDFLTEKTAPLLDAIPGLNLGLVKQLEDIKKLESMKDNIADPDGNEETIPGEEAAATAATKAEAERRALAQRLRAGDSVKGDAVPSVSSMRYKPGQSYMLLGIGTRLSGTYNVKKVTQSYEGGTLKTVLTVGRMDYQLSDKERDALGKDLKTAEEKAKTLDDLTETFWDSVLGDFKTTKVTKVDNKDDTDKVNSEAKVSNSLPAVGRNQ